MCPSDLDRSFGLIILIELVQSVACLSLFLQISDFLWMDGERERVLEQVHQNKTRHVDWRFIFNTLKPAERINAINAL